MTLKAAKTGPENRGETVSAEAIRGILAGDGHPPISKEALSKFVGDGMPRAGRGLYDRNKCTAWYLGRLRTNVHRKATESKDGKVLTLDEAQRRLTTVKAESEEMSLAERRGELIPITLHEAMLTNIVQVTKQRILNIPTRLGPKLLDCSLVEIKALLAASLKDALSEIARKEASLAAKKKQPTKRAKHGDARKSRPRKQ